MEIYQLRQFAAVAKTENMTRAAQSLSMAQPAVSKTIRNLESELGVELDMEDQKITTFQELADFIESKLN